MDVVANSPGFAHVIDCILRSITGDARPGRGGNACIHRITAVAPEFRRIAQFGESRCLRCIELRLRWRRPARETHYRDHEKDMAQPRLQTASSINNSSCFPQVHVDYLSVICCASITRMRQAQAKSANKWPQICANLVEGSSSSSYRE